MKLSFINLICFSYCYLLIIVNVTTIIIIIILNLLYNVQVNKRGLFFIDEIIFSIGL